MSYWVLDAVEPEKYHIDCDLLPYWAYAGRMSYAMHKCQRREVTRLGMMMPLRDEDEET